MTQYDDEMLQPIPPVLAPGEKEHMLLPQDETSFHTNDKPRNAWLKDGQQPLKSKGNGRGNHISDIICEATETGRLVLNAEQIAEQMALPEAERLRTFDARKIIYPGKNFDAWWDLEQLRVQMIDAVDIFEYLQPGKVGVWMFDCSSAHEGLAHDALNVNNMNIGPGGAQKHLRNTIIPLNNPPPLPGKEDTRGREQTMDYPLDHPDPKLRGAAKGMKAVLQERESVWDELTKRTNRVVGKCKSCSTSQIKKDAQRRVAAAEASGQEDSLTDAQVAEAETGDSASSAPQNDWCCMYRVLSLQDDFVHEKPLLQHYLEGRGHVCIFLPKFHCELNPIEMVWGLMKYCK